MRKKSSVFALLLLSMSSTGLSAPIAIKCVEPLPEFTLSDNARPTKSEIKQLCSCIWNQFPVKGWEREAAAALKNGRDPGYLYRNGFISRFGEALQRCGGYKL